MTRKEIYVNLGITGLSFALAIFSGAINWVIQFIITGLAYFIAGLVLGRRPESRQHWLRSALFVLGPYLLTYGAMAIVERLLHVHPIWMIGTLGYALGALAGTRLQQRRDLAIALGAYFLILVPGGNEFMYRWLAYVFRPVNTKIDKTLQFSLSTAGKVQITSEDLKGRVVVLNFWATSCGACVDEFPAFDALFREHQGDPDVVIYSVNIPLEGDTPDEIKQMTDGYAFPVLFTSTDVEAVKANFDIHGVPALLVLNRALVLRYHDHLTMGSHSFADRIDAHIQQVKQEPSGS